MPYSQVDLEPSSKIIGSHLLAAISMNPWGFGLGPCEGRCPETLGGGASARTGSHYCHSLAASWAPGDQPQLQKGVGKGYHSQRYCWTCCCLGGRSHKNLTPRIQFLPACHCRHHARWGCSRSWCAQIQQAGAAASEGQAGDSSSRPGTAAGSAAAGNAGAAEAAPSTSAAADGELLEEAVLQNANQLYR